jgi:proline iminopeptidase
VCKYRLLQRGSSTALQFTAHCAPIRASPKQCGAESAGGDMRSHTMVILAAVFASIFGILGNAPLAFAGSSNLQPGEGFVQVTGGKVWYRIVGSGDKTPLLLLHGGPGAPSYYLERLAALAEERPVIFYDQLGCGRSDRPHDTSLWTMERYIDELKRVRKAFGLKQIHILGHSWGSMLAIDYLLTKPQGVRSVILAGPVASVPRYVHDVQALRAQLPADVQATLSRHETAGTTESEEYQQAVMVFYKRYFIRADPWPAELDKTFAEFGAESYNTVQGPNEFTVTGWMKDYDRTPRLGELKLPVLFTAGRYDEITPDQAAWYQSLVPGSKLVIFENSAHMTMLDEPDHYVAVVREFLRSHDRNH